MTKVLWHNPLAQIKTRPVIVLTILILVVVALFLSAICALVSALTVGNRTNAQVVDVVDRYVTDGLDSSMPRIVAIHTQDDMLRFAVVRGRPGRTVLVATGEISDVSLDITERRARDALFPWILPAREPATCGLSRRWSRPMSQAEAARRAANLKGIIPDEDVERDVSIVLERGWQSDYRPTVLWSYAVQKQWFREDEPAVLVFIYPTVSTLGDAPSWLFYAHYAVGSAPIGNRGGVTVGARVSLDTLQISNAFSD